MKKSLAASVVFVRQGDDRSGSDEQSDRGTAGATVDRWGAVDAWSHCTAADVEAADTDRARKLLGGLHDAGRLHAQAAVGIAGDHSNRCSSRVEYVLCQEACTENKKEEGGHESFLLHG